MAQRHRRRETMAHRSTLLVVALTSWILARASVLHVWGEGAPLNWRPSAVADAGNGPYGPAPTQARQRPPVAAAAAQALEVRLQEQTYQPPLIHVRPGDTILFRNRDPYVHAVTLIHHEDILDQGFIEPLQTLTFVVPK